MADVPANSIDDRSSTWLRLRRWRAGLTPFNVVSIVVSLFLAFLAIYPMSRVLLRLFMQDGRLDLSAIREAWTLPDLPQLLGNTLFIVLASGVLALIIGSFLAWLNERTDARMGVFTDALPLVPFLLPPIAGAIGWVLLLSPRAGLLNEAFRDFFGIFGMDFVGPGGLPEGPLNIYSWWGMIFTYTLYQVPYVFLMISAGLRNMDPSLEEQSQVCGRGLLQTLRRVTIPGLRPSLAAAILLMVWFGFALFSVPVIIGTGANIEVLAVRIVRLLTFTFPPQTDVAVGLSLFVILFVGTAYWAQRRILSKGHHVTVGGKGHRHTRIELGKWRGPARLFMVGYVLLAAILPLIALILVALNNFWTPDINWDGLTLDAFRRALFDDIATQRALRNSVMLAVIGGALGIVAAAILALFVRRSTSKGAKVLDGMIKLPAAISTIVIAVGFILAFAGPPFNLHGTFLILLLAYLALYMPQGSVAADAAAGQVGGELMEASAISGASGSRTFWKVNLPIMLPGLVAGWALLFVRMAGDLSASAILSGLSNTVVGFRILEIFRGASYPLLAALAVILTAITSSVLILVMWFTRKKSSAGAVTGI